MNVGPLNGAGTTANASTVTNTATLNPGTTATAATLSIGGNFNFFTNATLTFNLTNNTTVGSGLNDLINIAGNLALSSNVVTFIPTASTLASGAYRLFSYS